MVFFTLNSIAFEKLWSRNYFEISIDEGFSYQKSKTQILLGRELKSRLINFQKWITSYSVEIFDNIKWTVHTKT